MFLVVEFESRVRTVASRVERRSLDEPGVAAISHQAGELAGNDPPRVVDQLLGQNNRRG